MSAIRTVLDFNRANLCEQPLNALINDLIERTEPPGENYRQYLGASAIGAACLRRVQYDWMCEPQHPARAKDIFARGHWAEARTRDHLIAAGFEFAAASELEFVAADGAFRGHADGKIVSGPQVPGLRYPCLWENKCVNSRASKAIERNGLTGHYEVYAGQVAIYQAYLDLTNPALFSVINADTCERLFFLIPFDPALAQMMSDRAVTVVEATRVHELLARITDDPDDWRCRMCQWRERCWR